MPKLSFFLATALSLSLSLAGTAIADDRYMTRPPVVVSPDLTAHEALAFLQEQLVPRASASSLPSGS